MRRGIAVSWHALSFLIAAVLYFFFALPRWWELMGDVSHGVGTTLRIVTGVLLGLTALPVVFDFLKLRRPEFGTPQLALTLRLCSIVGHVLAGVLIIGAAVTEIWVSLDDAGQWLFGVYGAAAAIATLAAAAFYLSLIAELPPAPPKPLKPKKAEKSDAAAENDAAAEADIDELEVTDEPSEDTPVADAAPEDSPVEDTPAEKPDEQPATSGGRLRNRRPSGKNRGGVAVSDD